MPTTTSSPLDRVRGFLRNPFATWTARRVQRQRQAMMDMASRAYLPLLAQNATILNLAHALTRDGIVRGHNKPRVFTFGEHRMIVMTENSPDRILSVISILTLERSVATIGFQPAFQGWSITFPEDTPSDAFEASFRCVERVLHDFARHHAKAAGIA